jgi:osmotically inducible protein OsmC
LATSKNHNIMKRKATAVWNGTGLEGSGHLTSPGGALNGTPYSYKTRFVSEDGTAGTNPEELIAAAHAGCFSMALSFQIANAGHVADELKCEAVIDLENTNPGFKIASVTLHLEGKVPGMTAEKFSELAEAAKRTCPVSVALSAVEIRLEARLRD